MKNNIKKLNNLDIVEHDSAPQFALNVHSMAKIAEDEKLDTSLNFDKMMQKSKFKHGKLRYPESKQIESIKMNYVDNNDLADPAEV